MRKDSTASEHDPKTVVFSLWFALLGSMVMYVVVGFLWQGNQSPSDQSAWGEWGAWGDVGPTLFFVFVGLSLVLTLSSFMVIPSIFEKKGKGREDLLITFFIARYAMAEVIAILGFVLFFGGGSFIVFVAFVVWAILLHLVMFPTEREMKNVRKILQLSEPSLEDE